MAIPIPSIRGRLLKFDRLDNSGSAIPVYTIGWRIVDEPGDLWTKRFLAFKADVQKGFLGGAFLMREAIREIIALEGLEAHKTALATALSSRATKLDENSVLHRTGKWIAEQTGLSYRASSFTKRSHRSLHSLGSSSARDTEVQGKYTSLPMNGISTLIIIDDFVTRGSTLNEMKRAVDAATPKIRIIGLALGKNEKASYASRFGYKVTNSHIPTSLNTLWTESSKRGEK